MRNPGPAHLHVLRHRWICAVAMLAAAVSGAAWSATELPRVEVTGSQLRRIPGETDLPVRTLTRADIDRSGATSVTDLIQRLPMMQGHQPLSDSVGNDGGGLTTASIHNLGARYTLVLVDGQRLASADSGAVVDLNTLPLAAIERVEVLADGASAVYGADAIGGVVNLILRRQEAPLAIRLTTEQPSGRGGASSGFSLSQGLGDLDRDGRHLSWVFSHERQQALHATDRAVSATGFVRFHDAGGRELLFFNGSMRSAPANVVVNYTDAAGQAQAAYLNPGLLRDGACAAGHLEAGGFCYHDYAATVDDAPRVERSSLTLTGLQRLDAGWTWRGTALLSDTLTRVRLAPYPADVALSADAPQFTASVRPWLTSEQLNGLDSVVLSYRLQDLGPRVVDYRQRLLHLSTGVEGAVADWQVRAALTWSGREMRQDLRSGWVLSAPFEAGVASGAIDPFAPAGQQTAAGLAALDGATWQGRLDTARSAHFGAEVHAETDLFPLLGGAAQLGVGGEWRRAVWRKTVSDVARGGALLAADPQQPFDVQRDNAGVYTELLLPVASMASLTGSLRYDHIGAVDDRLNDRHLGLPGRQFTGRLGLRWQPSRDVLWRASAGTGFRVPDMLQVVRQDEDGGVTAGTYACPFTAANGLAEHPLAGLCWPGSRQVEVLQGGNPALRPERSTQWSLGLVLEPADTLTLGADLWSVRVRDAVQTISERLILSDPVRYADFYTTQYKAATGTRELALRLLPVNLGRLDHQGLDWQLAWRHGSPWGRWTHRLEGTWLLRSRYTVPGTDGEWASSLGRFGVDDRVAFRHIVALSSVLAQGRWTHQARLGWRSGYTDMPHTENDCAVTTPDGMTCVAVQLDVPAHWTLDWTSTWRPTRDVELSMGVSNVFNRRPPLTLRTVGAHMIGYDPRYASAQGRALQIAANWRF